jgi:hypothetical protein
MYTRSRSVRYICPCMYQPSSHRNAVFLWTSLLLGGEAKQDISLVSLRVPFQHKSFRVESPNSYPRPQFALVEIPEGCPTLIFTSMKMKEPHPIAPIRLNNIKTSKRTCGQIACSYTSAKQKSSWIVRHLDRPGLWPVLPVDPTLSDRSLVVEALRSSG